jgi:hypothetical protein
VHPRPDLHSVDRRARGGVSVTFLDESRHDLWLALRGLGRARAFAGAAILTLGLGIAATTVMFALIQGVLIRPLPVRDQDRLLLAWTEIRSTGFSHWPFLMQDVDLIAKESRLLETVAGVGYNGAMREVAIENGSASYIRSVSVTGDFSACSASSRFLAGRFAAQTT